MARHKHIPYVVLSAHDKTNKGIIAYKPKGMSGYSVGFVQLKNEGDIDFGDTFENEAIEGIYFSIYFAKVESVKAVIKQLERVRELMERDIHDDGRDGFNNRGQNGTGCESIRKEDK